MDREGSVDGLADVSNRAVYTRKTEAEWKGILERYESSGLSIVGNVG